MKLLIDEDSIDRFLVKRLREAGHDVLTVVEAGLASSPDDVVFALARSERRDLLTRNVDDLKRCITPKRIMRGFWRSTKTRIAAKYDSE